MTSDATKATARPWAICDGEGYESSHPNDIYKATAVNSAEKLAQIVLVLSEELQELSEHTSTHLEDMGHYFDNKCCPTVEEVNACAAADNSVRIALEKANAIARGN
jgi:hypothetical protein